LSLSAHNGQDQAERLWLCSGKKAGTSMIKTGLKGTAALCVSLVKYNLFIIFMTRLNE
jgi:hypothetical protein